MVIITVEEEVLCFIFFRTSRFNFLLFFSGGTNKVCEGKRVILAKRRWNISQPDCRDGGNEGFSRYEYELGDKNGYVLVHYVGDHTL